MFANGELSRGWRMNGWIAGSLACHAVLFALLLRRPEPVFVAPSYVAWGNGAKTSRVVYVAPLEGDVQSQSREQQEISPKTVLPAAKPKKVAKPKPKANISNEGEIAETATRAGKPFGLLDYGAMQGHDVRPALPTVFPDPPVARADIPDGVQGLVVVEVTIDEVGNVIETKLLQGIGHGIDEKVIATLQNWRYRPATIDGRPIASRHDVRFHFPS